MVHTKHLAFAPQINGICIAYDYIHEVSSLGRLTIAPLLFMINRGSTQKDSRPSKSIGIQFWRVPYQFSLQE